MMSGISREIETLAKEIAQIQAERPHLASLLEAFGPLLLARSRWLLEVGDGVRKFPIDEMQYLGGVPLIRQCELFLPEDPWKSAGLSIAGAIGQGFPQLAEDMAGLSQRIAAGNFDCFSLLDAAVLPDEAQLAARAGDLGIAPASLQFFMRILTRLMLGKREREMAAELAPLSWKKGYCPVCGSFPHLAILREQGQKWLQCPSCSHEWQFPRLTCPFCEHEDPENTNYLFVEGKKEDTAFTCEKCRRYLVTSDYSGNLGRTHADLIALSLAHLDLILQDKGFLPMAECEWNVLASPREIGE